MPSRLGLELEPVEEYILAVFQSHETLLRILPWAVPFISRPLEFLYVTPFLRGKAHRFSPVEPMVSSFLY